MPGRGPVAADGSGATRCRPAHRVPDGEPARQPVTARPAWLHRGPKLLTEPRPFLGGQARDFGAGAGGRGVQLERAQAQSAFHRPDADVHVLHAAVRDHHGALEEDAAADQQVVVALGVADGPDLARNQQQPPQGQHQHHAGTATASHSGGHVHQPSQDKDQGQADSTDGDQVAEGPLHQADSDVLRGNPQPGDAGRVNRLGRHIRLPLWLAASRVARQPFRASRRPPAGSGRNAPPPGPPRS